MENLDERLYPVQALDIDQTDLGMVIGPLDDDDEDVWKIAVNVRSKVDGYDTDLDVEYTFEGLEGGDVLDDIYPEFIDQIRERYGEMQLQYTDPEI
jgi:hypothetical protein